MIKVWAVVSIAAVLWLGFMSVIDLFSARAFIKQLTAELDQWLAEHPDEEIKK